MENEDFVKDLTLLLADECGIPVRELQSKITEFSKDYNISRQITGAPHTTDGSTTNAIWNEFVKEKLAQGLKQNSLKQYYFAVSDLVKITGKEVDLILSEDINACYAYWRNVSHLGDYTMYNRSHMLHSFYKFVVCHHYIKENPVDTAVKLKYTPKVKKAFTRGEIEMLVLACETKYADNDELRKRSIALLYMLLESGMRISELCSLKISDIDFTARRAIVMGKGNKQREVFFGEITLVRLYDYLNNRSDVTVNNGQMSYPLDAPLFARAKGERCGITTRCVESQMKQLGTSAGVNKVHPHRCRRTMASIATKRNIPITTTAALLGHASIATTQLYIEVTEQEKKLAVDSLL